MSSPPSDSSSSEPPPPAADDSPSPPPPSSDSSPPPPAPESPPPPASSPPPPKSDGSPPPPSQSSTPPPPSGKDNGKSDTKSPPPPKSKSSPPSPPSHSGNDHPRRNSPELEDGSGKRDDSSNHETAIIAGAAAGAALLLCVFIAFLLCCCRKKKRKNPDHELKYYRDNNNNNSRENANNNYYSNSSPHDYMVKIPPPPQPVSAAVSSEYGWSPAPPPRPPNMCSSELNSAGFSGPYQAALPPPHPAVSLGFNQSSFSYEDLAAATGGFAQGNLLGQGGFGYVHKGVLPNGKEIAVKSLKSNSGQGEREFHAEVDIISRVHHRHLVSLVGYCSTGAQRLLVYEFVSNGTLEYHLHGVGRPTMDWPTRHRIALGSAKGFAYLHEDCHPRIIHRDIKAANILIDSNFEAKVADFGLAKLSNDNFTHVSTRIMGTFGYLAPEYASSGKLTEKSDVYSFGVMLLELITGRRPVDISSDDDSLVDWARPILTRVPEGGSYEELVDPRLQNNYDPNEMLHMVACAGACIRHSARGRPKMSQIVRALEGDVSLDDLNAGPKTTSTLSTLSSSDSDYDLRRFAKSGVTSSQEYSSSEEHTVDFHSRS